MGMRAHSTFIGMAALFLLATGALTGPARGADDEPATREELEAQQARIERHLLRVQQAAFEAEARGEDSDKVKHLQREFRHTGQRRSEVKRKIEAAE